MRVASIRQIGVGENKLARINTKANLDLVDERCKQSQGAAHSAHEGYRCERVHLLDFVVVLGSLGAHHIKLRSAHRVAHVDHLSLAGLAENIVDFGRNVVETHFMPPAINKIISLCII